MKDGGDKIWIPKAICLISTYPFYDFMSGILLDLFYTVFHDYDHQKLEQKQKFMVEQYVKHLVDGLPPYAKGLKIRYKIMSQYLIKEKIFENDEILLQIPSDNELSFVNKRFFDRFFQILRAEEVVALYTALISEDKTILVVCENEFDLIPFSTVLTSLMYPFEWCMSNIPYVVLDPDDPNIDLLEFVNTPQSIILGIHRSAYEEIKLTISEEKENCKRIIVVDLSNQYSCE